MTKPNATQAAWNHRGLRQPEARPKTETIAMSDALSWWCCLSRAELNEAIQANLPRMAAVKTNTRIYQGTKSE